MGVCDGGFFNGAYKNEHERSDTYLYRVGYTWSTGPSTPTLKVYGWYPKADDFTATNPLNPPNTIIDHTKLVLTPPTLSFSTLDYYIGRPSNVWPLEKYIPHFAIPAGLPPHIVDAQTHFQLLKSDTYFNEWAWNVQNISIIPVSWMVGETQIMWSINEVLAKSSYSFVVGGKNILDTAVTTTVRYNFWCDLNNTGVNIVWPTDGYHYYAIEKTGLSTFGDGKFLAWSETIVYTGCGFVKYVIAADPLYPTEVT